MVDALGTSTYGFTSIGQLLSEDGPWENDAVSYTYANRLRSGLSLARPTGPSWTVSYAHDGMKRLTNVTSSAGRFGYTYREILFEGHILEASAYEAGLPTPYSLPGSRVEQLTLPGGSAVHNEFDLFARQTATALKNSSATVLNQHLYDYDDASRRTKQTRTSGDYVDYTYDETGQLTGAEGKESGGTTNRWQERFYYGYDAAGNLSDRVQNVQTNVFNVDILNQLTSVVRTNLSATVAGATTLDATSVTVAANGGSATAAIRFADRTYARTNVTLADGNNTFVAVATSGTRGDTNTVTVNLPATVTFVYDLNGNLRTNGTRVLEYDDENQLTRVTEPSAWKAEFVYDGKLRMRVSRDYEWRNGAWVLTNEVHRVYDGMLVLQERDQFNVPKLTYTRGKDLSGSLEGAGGIGGLLALSEMSNLSSPIHSYFHADGNGNVTALVDTNQNVVARYLFDPFGNTLSATGPKASVNSYRFSSKEWHAASGMVYYGYRWYIPELQRWGNRDPIQERGGINLFRFVGNQPVDLFDLFGLASEATGIKICRGPALGDHTWIEYEGGAVGFYPGEGGIWGGTGDIQDPDKHRDDTDKICSDFKVDPCKTDKDCLKECVGNLKYSRPGNYCVIGSACHDWVNDSLKECKRKCAQSPPKK